MLAIVKGSRLKAEKKEQWSVRAPIEKSACELLKDEIIRQSLRVYLLHLFVDGGDYRLLGTGFCFSQGYT